jgi:hypothetical protein
MGVTITEKDIYIILIIMFVSGSFLISFALIYQFGILGLYGVGSFLIFIVFYVHSVISFYKNAWG